MVGVPVKVVQVVRNPYDNIATMSRRGHKRPLAEHVDNYFELAETVRALRDASTPTGSTSFAWRPSSPSRRPPSIT